ncbi:uncharacterized protein ACRADG_006560 [Cochliomyia hominivorax]
MDHQSQTLKNTISFDKQEIRKKIILPTFKQARRSANIYEALIQEFHEEGCPTSAKYFEMFVRKEQKLYENAAIRERIFENKNLLLQLFDNCKMAEKSALFGQYNGANICSRLLLQCVLLLQSYGKKFDWILMDVFRKIIKICEKVCKAEEVSKESLCRIYYKFGKYLTKSDFEESVKYLDKSFDLAKGTNWMDDNISDNGKYLHFTSIIVETYATALLDYANNIYQKETQKAICKGQKAIIILTGDVEHNKNLYIKAYLDMTKFQLESKNYENCLSILGKIIKFINNSALESQEYLKFLSRYHHLKGVCLESLKKHDQSLPELYESLKIAHQLQLKRDEGIILLDIAKAYITRGRSQFRLAELCLRQAKQIFVDLNDMFNTRKTSYLMANLKVQNIQPLVLDLIKSSSHNYCDKYRLLYWKSMCLPFWRNLRLTLEQEEFDEKHCLMQATEIPAKNGERKSFQRKAP